MPDATRRRLAAPEPRPRRTWVALLRGLACAVLALPMGALAEPSEPANESGRDVAIADAADASLVREPTAREALAGSDAAETDALEGALTERAEQAPATGWAFQGLPLFNFNTDTGFGYGGQVVVVDRADGTWRPWRASIMLRYWATTENIYGHILSVDLPRFMGTAWRMGLELQASRNLYNPWFGLGNEAAYDEAWSTCMDRSALAANPDVCPGNASFRGLRYGSYELSALPRVILNLRVPLTGDWSLFLGHRLRLESIRLGYTAEELGQSAPSVLAQDAAAGRVGGLDGTVLTPQSQRTSELAAGVQFDTRDLEATPTSGMFHELSTRAGLGAIGSEFNYWGATLHARGWVPIPGTSRQLIVALRGLADVMGGEVPVSLMPFFGGLEAREGIGGTASVRGVLRNRYQGPVKALGNAEVHWRPLTFRPFSQRIELGLMGFFDAGRVWSDLAFADGGGLTTSTGGGVRLIWNQVMVVRADYGVGLTEPTQGFYLEMGHVF